MDGLHAVEGKAGGAGGAARALERGVDGGGIGQACGADAVITGKDLIAEVAGISAQAMLVDTVVGTEGAAAPGQDFEIAPAAARESVGAEGELRALDAAATKSSRDEHAGVRIGWGGAGWK